MKIATLVTIICFSFVLSACSKNGEQIAPENAKKAAAAQFMDIDAYKAGLLLKMQQNRDKK